MTHVVKFSKKGYKSSTVRLFSKVGGLWVVLDVVFGLVPLIVDAATGNWLILTPAYVNQGLEAE